jgi:hypothetical protein
VELRKPQQNRGFAKTSPPCRGGFAIPSTIYNFQSTIPPSIRGSWLPGKGLNHSYGKRNQCW